MAASSQLAVRRVVPRWRSFDAAVQAGELDPTELRKRQLVSGDDAIKRKEEEWRANKELLFATDLVGAAQIFGVTETAKEAADYILNNAGKTSQLARRLAARVLGFAEPRVDDRIPVDRNQFHQDARLKIAELKDRRIAEPRNAFVWADLARTYVLLGLPDQAETALHVALALAPSDRFILRIAARFFLHRGDPERALFLLRDAERTRIDPWLMAAEIAVSQVAEKSSKFLKAGYDLVERRAFKPFHSSELTSALGSQRFWDGNTRAAKKLFSQSLIEPTENALAQAVWAARDVGLLIPDKALEGSKAAEARSLAARNSGEWLSAYDLAKRWIQEEPFSSRPYSFASALGVSILGKASEAELLARSGLETNPNHPGLVNNVAFALVEKGDAEMAKEALSDANWSIAAPTAKICLVATTGLVEYRLGHHSEGRKLYTEAIRLAQEEGDKTLKALAQIYLAREEARIGAEGFSALFDRAARELAKHGTPQAIAVATVVQRQIEASFGELLHSAAARPGEKAVPSQS